MAWYDTLNIPSGLEELFAKVLQLKPNGTITGIGVTLPQQNHARAKRTSDRSPVVLLHPYWLTCTSSQKLAWQSYWSTLPYGAHVGAGGWPGSGFSAFVHVNASRLKAGLEILLDPPVYENLVPNGNFSGNAAGWDLHNFAYVLNDVEVIDPSGGAEAISSFFTLKQGHTYRLSAYADTTNATLEIPVDNDASPYDYDQGWAITAPQIVTFDFTNTFEDSDTWFVDLIYGAGDGCKFSNVSVVEIA